MSCVCVVLLDRWDSGYLYKTLFSNAVLPAHCKKQGESWSKPAQSGLLIRVLVAVIARSTDQEGGKRCLEAGSFEHIWFCVCNKLLLRQNSFLWVPVAFCMYSSPHHQYFLCEMQGLVSENCVLFSEMLSSCCLHGAWRDSVGLTPLQGTVIPQVPNLQYLRFSF